MSRWLKEHKAFVYYVLISVFVTVLDIAVSLSSETLFWPLFFKTDKNLCEQFGNALGVVIGFIVQYFLCSKKVYNRKDIRSFLIFLGTFLIGFALAQGIIYVIRDVILRQNDLPWTVPIVNMPIRLAFWLAKFASIVIPFFVMYFLRKKWIGQNHEGDEAV